ncbi:hypothetical protein [Maridesulfovibrio ferrireducens]|uniref:CASTOR/POLLUX-related putative ion channel n=1 Tax=Maridesulfovibrio ferrireducens TaxID=246191 RepID=UPI001A33AE9F|nr:hypothetical protein [Maridesulfovibrio ferrireducens]MBI9112741.1 hypothetical protein [Maridesulfovibrio ferrireducens]
MYFSKRLKQFFITPAIAGVIALSILIYVALTLISVSEATSMYDGFLFWLNCVFILEIFLRAFTFRKFTNYIKAHTLDAIAVFPWDIVIFYATGHAVSSNLLVVIRLVRLFRIGSFLSLWRDSLKSRIAYTIKKQIEQSLFRQCLILLGAIVSLTIIFGFMFRIIGYNREGTSLFYMAFMALLDPGTSMEVAGNSLIIQVVFNFLTMLGIILFNGLTIGIIVAKVESYLNRVQDGYGDVVEKNHTLMLGWNLLGQQLLEEINDYAKHESKHKQKIVIVTEQIDKLSNFLKSGDYKYLDLIKRKGVYFESSTLELVDISHASKVIILNETSDISLPLQFRKSDVFKGCLAVKSALSSLENKPLCYYESTCRTNRRRLIPYLADNFLEFNSAKYSALLLTTLLFHKHYYDILIELFGFSNDEFHFVKASEYNATGKTFSEVLVASKKVTPVGIVEENGHLEILPAAHYELAAEDSLILLAESRHALFDEKLEESWTDELDIKIKNFTASNQGYQLERQKIVVIGVNETLPNLLNELSLWNTYVDIITTNEGIKIAADYLADIPVKHKHVEFYTGDISDYDLKNCFGTIILADDEHVLNVGAETGDTDSLFKLFDIKSRLTEHPVIAEVINPSEESLFQKIDGVKYIVGTNILSKILNMSLVYPDAMRFFDELISLNGGSLNFARLSDMLKKEDVDSLSFVDFFHHFYQTKGCIAIGIVRVEGPPLVNPLRTEQLKQPEYSNFNLVDGKLQMYPDDEIVFLEKH